MKQGVGNKSWVNVTSIKMQGSKLLSFIFEGKNAELWYTALLLFGMMWAWRTEQK